MTTEAEPALRPPPRSTPKPRRGSGRTSVTDDAITSIRRMILVGELVPGDRLPPEAELAATLGLSRTSLREAVRALTILGVIDTRQGDGSYITGLGPELLLGALGLAVDLQRESGMLDLVGVRRVLEPSATALAATRISAEQLSTLQSCLELDLNESAGDPSERSLELDWDFHHIIASASGNALLAVLLDGLAAPTVRMRVWRGHSVPGALDSTISEHRAIYDALAAGDAELAQAAATLHVAGVESWVRSLQPGWSALAEHEVPEHHGFGQSRRAARERPA